MSIDQSSQFASALLLCAEAGNWRVEVLGENTEESPYVRMTSELVKAFPKSGGAFQIEPDASSGSYFLAAGELLKDLEFPTTLEYSEQFRMDVPTKRFTTIKVAHWPTSGWQIDQDFEMFSLMHATLAMELPTWPGRLPARVSKWAQGKREISRRHDLGDSIMTAIVLAPFARVPLPFIDLGRLRLQECERVVALRTELTKCGAMVTEEADTLTIHPSALHGAEIETYNDHRMAMCFAILGLKVPGMKVHNPACVKKTFPNFFQKLAAQPPSGLGARILDGKSGRALDHAELFAG